MKKKYLLTIFCVIPLSIQAEFIVSGAEGMRQDAKSSCEFALNIGPGWYKTDSALRIPQTNGDSLISIVKTKMKTFAALVSEITVQPHKNCFGNINIGAGWLRSGTSIFIDIQNHKLLRRECAPFDGDFFNVNVTAGMQQELSDTIHLEESLGYSYDHGKLTTAGPHKPNYNIFDYNTLGPVMAFGINYAKRKISCNATYSFILGAYTEKNIDKIANKTLIIRIPKVFVNHLDIVTQYNARKDITIGLVISLDFFKNHGIGTTQPCYDIGSLKNPTVPYDTTTTILFLGFASISF